MTIGITTAGDLGQGSHTLLSRSRRSCRRPIPPERSCAVASLTYWDTGRTSPVVPDMLQRGGQHGLVIRGGSTKDNRHLPRHGSNLVVKLIGAADFGRAKRFSIQSE